MSLSRRAPIRPRGACVSVCLLLFLSVLPANTYEPPPAQPESLRAVVVTIDGIRDLEFHQWNGRLIA